MRKIQLNYPISTRTLIPGIGKAVESIDIKDRLTIADFVGAGVSLTGLDIPENLLKLLSVINLNNLNIKDLSQIDISDLKGITEQIAESFE